MPDATRNRTEKRVAQSRESPYNEDLRFVGVAVQEFLGRDRFMRFPLKISAEWLPAGLRKKTPFLVNANPRSLLQSKGYGRESQESKLRIAFSEAVTALSSGTTWKTTRANRHPNTDALILRFCSDKRCVFLDVGVSDGITTLELINKLNGSYEEYHATDVSFTTQVVERHGKAYFYDSGGRCTVVAAPSYVAYDSFDGALFPFSSLARRALSMAPQYDAAAIRPVSLANPELRAMADSDSRIVIQDYSVFDPWTGTPPDVIKIANVLNREYFSDEMLRAALKNLKTCLKPDGMLVVTDNRNIEQVSTFVKAQGRLELQDQVNGGCSVANLVVGI